MKIWSKIASFLLSTTLLLTLCACSEEVSVPNLSTGDTSYARPTFTMEEPPEYPVINSITDHPTLGDEREFVRIYDSDGNEYIDSINIQPHQNYEVRIYYMNDSQLLIKTVRVKSTLPSNISDTAESLTARIECLSAEYPTPGYITDSISITADQRLNLFLVKDSVQETFFTNSNSTVTNSISTQELFGKGHYVGQSDGWFDYYVYPSGKILQYVSYVIFATPASE